MTAGAARQSRPPEQGSHEEGQHPEAGGGHWGLTLSQGRQVGHRNGQGGPSGDCGAASSLLAPGETQPRVAGKSEFSRGARNQFLCEIFSFSKAGNKPKGFGDNVRKGPTQEAQDSLLPTALSRKLRPRGDASPSGVPPHRNTSGQLRTPRTWPGLARSPPSPWPFSLQ